MLLDDSMSNSFMMMFNGSTCTLVNIPTSVVFNPSLISTALVTVWVTQDQAPRVQGLGERSLIRINEIDVFVDNKIGIQRRLWNYLCDVMDFLRVFLLQLQ